MVVSLIKRLREPELWWVRRTPRGKGWVIVEAEAGG